jgi:dolichol-phosphate mannosyltransferase
MALTVLEDQAARIKAALAGCRIAAVVPCYRVKDQAAGVVKAIGPLVEKIYCVDDGCPEETGKHLQQTVKDPRLTVLFHGKNRGVGAAVKTGYAAALADGMDIALKIDGDGQMDCTKIPEMVQPILLGQADYVKGNRFFNLEDLKAMPRVRLIGNAGLSFLTKLSSGYWNIYDPSNGFTAIQTLTLRSLPLEKVAERYFFESDMLFRLNTLGALVQDVPMAARYGGEPSSLRIGASFFHFLGHNLKNLVKRVFYNYLLRDFNVASAEILVGAALLAFGIAFGLLKWWGSIQTGVAVTSGTVMMAALPIILGVQLVLAFVSYDTRVQATRPFFLRTSQPPA